MSEPLPPCPLCGGQADIELDPNERGAMNWAIVCTHCFARGPIVRNQWEAPDAWRRLARAVARADEADQLRAAIRAYIAGLDNQYPGVVMWDLEQALRALAQE